MKTYVLVTATATTLGKTSKVGAGIRKLKRGIKLEEFITSYIQEFNLADVELFQRNETTMLVSNKDNTIASWAFTEYKDDDLLEAVSHLSKEELLRDLKELLPLKDNW